MINFFKFFKKEEKERHLTNKEILVLKKLLFFNDIDVKDELKNSLVVKIDNFGSLKFKGQRFKLDEKIKHGLIEGEYKKEGIFVDILLFLMDDAIDELQFLEPTVFRKKYMTNSLDKIKDLSDIEVFKAR